MTEEKKKERLRYNKRKMQWETKDGIQKNPKKPVWAIKGSGVVPFGKFIRAWTDADELEDVHKTFWWKSPAQLKRQRSEINDWFDDHGGIQTRLTTLPSGAQRRKRWGRELKKLIDDGVVKTSSKKDVGTSTIERTGLADGMQKAIDLHNDLQAKEEAKQKRK
jgi:hypothetical protein